MSDFATGETDNGIVVSVDVQKKNHILPGDIAEIVPSFVSAMPNGLADSTGIADVITFLLSNGG